MSRERLHQLRRLSEMLRRFDDAEHDQAMLLLDSLGDAHLRRAVYERLVTGDRCSTALRLIKAPDAVFQASNQLPREDRFPQWSMWWTRYLAEPTLTPALAAPLARLDLYGSLPDCCPAVIGTLPLGIDVPGSDLDIALQVLNVKQTALRLRELWGHLPDFTVTRGKTQGAPSALVGFSLDGLPVEIFASRLPLMHQHGVAHFHIEVTLLGLLGPSFREAVMRHRAAGLKTEPAFAEALKLPGDPYEAVLRLQTHTDDAIVTCWEGLQPMDRPAPMMPR